MSSRRKRGCDVCRMASATSRRPDRASSEVSAIEAGECALRRGRGRLRVVLVESAAAAVARIRGSSSASIGRASDAASSLLIAPRAAIAPARTAASGSASSRRMFGAQRRVGLAARLGERAQRARPHLRRLVIEEQRRDQVALVERLEHVDRIDDALCIRLRQLLDERLDGREVGGVQPHLLRLDDALFDAAAERGQVFALGAYGP